MSPPVALPQQLAPGLYRWTAPHPEWDPAAPPGSSGDWPRDVGCTLYDAPAAAVLIDPLLPTEGREELLAWLDEHLAGRPVSILTTIQWHRRDRELLAARYAGRGERAWNAVPAGVEPRPLRGAGETVYWLPGARTLVFGDRLIGASDGSGRAALCPESWLSRVRVDRAGLAHQMRPLIELDVERLLVSHGEPVLHDGRAELARAIGEAEKA
ncbi:MAG TPA: hypothetical protein VN618_15755 [Solirubrobacteraceae bacterium]|nr:hypothetical protein [Solirubrobacteraceae bacterium]